MMVRIVAFLLLSFNVNAQLITSYAGNGTASYNGDGIPATSASINRPIGGFFDEMGNYYIASYSGQRIRKIDTNGTITTIAGTGSFGYSGDSGPATDAQLGNPVAAISDTLGNIYIAESQNSRIRKIDIATGSITTVVGTGAISFSGDNGPATAAAINDPQDICFDNWGNLYIADFMNSRIRKVSTDGIITTFAGTGSAGETGDGGPATNAQITAATGIASDNVGNIYIADRGGNKVRKINTSGIISTIAGNGNATYSGDEIPAKDAQLSPTKICINSSHELIIADDYNKRVFKVDAAGIIHLIGGNGGAGSNGDNGPATAAEIYPSGVTVDRCDNVYISTANYHVIRKITYNQPPCYPADVKAMLVGFNINIYPNPVYEELNIDISHPLKKSGDVTYMLRNMMGVVIQKGFLHEGNNSIPVNSLLAGVYMVEIQDPSTTLKVIKKIVKQ